MSNKQPRKKQRASRACDFCHKRSVRCKLTTNVSGKCQNCIDYDVACTYSRPWKRARPAARSTFVDSEEEQSSFASQSNSAVTNKISSKRQSTCQDETNASEALDPAWRAFAEASSTQISLLLDVYFQIVYPIFPFFHRASLRQRLESKEYLTNRSFFASVMAACALVSARVRDGAIPFQHQAQLAETSSETYYRAAKDSIPKKLASTASFNVLRACALLAITSIQHGKIDAVHEWLGHYLTLTAIHRFHDERQWPSPLDSSEREERRRLYWSIYTLEIYASIVWNGPLRSREVHCHVLYPQEIDLDIMPDNGNVLSDPLCWLHGWNFTTDLYRILEHTIDRLRARRRGMYGKLEVDSLFGTCTFSGPDVLRYVLDMYSTLPTHFKATPPLTGDESADISGFQAANISATLQLLRIVLFSVEEMVDIEKKCAVARDVLETLNSVPVAYLKAISTPLIYHLAGIGTILGSVMENPLPQESYHRVRVLLLSMADLLENLESDLYRTAGASQGLRTQVDKIDQYMRAQHSASAMNVQSQAANSETLLPHANPTLLPDLTTEEFQLAPALLDNWPWQFDLFHDFGEFNFNID